MTITGAVYPSLIFFHFNFFNNYYLPTFTQVYYQCMTVHRIYVAWKYF